MTHPLVSIVLATYNGEKFLHQQLDSLINQTYKNIEIIIADDCSTDSTVEIIKEYINQYSYISLFQQEKNVGYQKNFEKAATLANGEFIAFCDQDDIWHLEKIEILISEIGDFSIVYANSLFIDSNNKPFKKDLNKIRKMNNFISPIQYIYGTAAAGHAMLIKKEIIKNAIPFPTIIPHDYWLGFIASLANGVKYVDKILVYYRKHETNVVENINKNNSLHRNFTKNKTSEEIRQLKYQKLQLFYEKCPDFFSEKKILYHFMKSYEKKSFKTNFNRMFLFFKNIDLISSHKKRNKLRKYLFCIKAFYKYL